jgi:ribosomal protein S18 acetylase RimI-like enzyme
MSEAINIFELNIDSYNIEYKNILKDFFIKWAKFRKDEYIISDEEYDTLMSNEINNEGFLLSYFHDLVKEFRVTLATTHMFGNSIDRKCIGFAIYERQKTPYEPEPFIWLFALWVDEAYRKQHIATQMLNDIYINNEDCTYCSLICRKDNENLAFYEKLGLVNPNYNNVDINLKSIAL